MYNELERILEACPAIPSRTAISYLTVSGGSRRAGAGTLGGTCPAVPCAAPRRSRVASQRMHTHFRSAPSPPAAFRSLPTVPRRPSSLQAFQHAGQETKRCQYASLRKRYEAGKADEIVTCVLLWLAHPAPDRAAAGGQPAS